MIQRLKICYIIDIECIFKLQKIYSIWLQEFKIEVKNLSANWSENEHHNNNLEDISFIANEKSLTAVIGEVGSGKVFTI